MKRILKYALMGMIIGFLSSSIATGKLVNGWNMEEIAYPLTILLAIASTIVYVIYIYTVFQIKKASKIVVSNAEQDERDSAIKRKLSVATLSSTTFITLALAVGSIALITEQSIWLLIFSLALIIVSIPSSLFLNQVIQIVYKERNLPHIVDKNYSKKLFETADEGERHIMLDGLYSTYTLMNVLLPLSIIVLMFYSEISGESQLFAIFIISIMMITLNARYTLKIRSQY